MKRVLCILFSLCLIALFSLFAFADEIEPFDEPGNAGYAGYTSAEFSPDAETEEPLNETDEKPVTESRESEISRANLIFAGAAAVACTGWVCLIIINKKRKTASALTIEAKESAAE